MHPPVPLKCPPGARARQQITVGLLPRRLRREYGFRWDPVREVAARTGAEYTKRVLVPLLPDRVRARAQRARRRLAPQRAQPAGEDGRDRLRAGPQRALLVGVALGAQARVACARRVTTALS